MSLFFSYHPEDGLCTFKTIDEAKRDAQECLDAEREQARSDEWQDSVEEIFYGEIKGRSIMTTYEEPRVSPAKVVVEFELKEI